MANTFINRQLLYGCVLVGLTASIQYTPLEHVVDQECALVLNTPRTSVYDYGLNLLGGSVGGGPAQACITYDDINQAYIDAMKRINVAQPQGTEWKTEEIATVGELLLDITAQLTKRFGLTLEDLDKGLPLIDTSKTLIRDVCPPYLANVECQAGKYRRHDGLCNNLNNPTWGATMTPFTRLVPPNFADGLSAPRMSVLGHDLPISRIVSRTMHPDEGYHDHAGTVMVIAWGQFMDHDFTLTATPLDARNKNEPEECCGRPPHLKHPYCLEIEIPDDDYFYHQFGQKCQDFVRSFPAARPGCRLGSKIPYNTLTGVIDGNTVYGVNEGFSRHLQSGIGGQLRMNPVFAEYGLKDLLPLKLDIPDEGCTRSNSSQYCFEAGEIRVNEQLVLACMHTIMAREHNRIAMEFAKINPHWDDETLYQEARRIVIAEIQHITFNEFLPIILGKDVMEKFGLMLQKEGYWDGYDHDVNPNIIAAFSAAAFRFGHSLLPTAVERWSKAHKFISSKRLSDLIRRPYDLYRAGVMDEYLMGLMNQVAQAMDDSITQEVTNHLLKKPGHHFGLDLVAFNMQRGREFGVPGYMEYRKFCGLDVSDTFEGMFGSMPNTTVFRYASIFDHPSDVDLWSGGVSERPLPGSMLGPTFACIIATQMSFVRRGDRFWYELPNQPSSFTPEQLQEIRKIKLSRILCDNTDLIDTIQIYPMVLPDHEINPRVPCRSGIIPSIDLTKWAEFPGGHIGDNLQFATDDKRDLKKDLGINKTTISSNLTEFIQNKPEKEAVTLKIFTVKEKPSLRLQILDNEIIPGNSVNYVATSPVLYITMHSPRAKRDILKIHPQGKHVSNLTETSNTNSPRVRSRKAEVKTQALLKRPQRIFSTNTWTTIRKSIPGKIQFESVRTKSLNKQSPSSGELKTNNSEEDKKGKEEQEHENEEEDENNSQKIVDVHDELDLEYEYVPLKQDVNGKMYVDPSVSSVDDNDNYGENFYQNIQHNENNAGYLNKNNYNDKTPNYNSNNDVTINYNNNDKVTPNYNSNTKDDIYIVTPSYGNNYDEVTPSYNSHDQFSNYDEETQNYNSNRIAIPNIKSYVKNSHYQVTPSYNTKDNVYIVTPSYDSNYNEVTPSYNSHTESGIEDVTTPSYNSYIQSSNEDVTTHSHNDYIQSSNEEVTTPSYNSYIQSGNEDVTTHNYNDYIQSGNEEVTTPSYKDYIQGGNKEVTTPSYDTYTQSGNEEVTTPSYNSYTQSDNEEVIPHFNIYDQNNNYEITPSFYGYNLDTPRKQVLGETGFHETGVDFVLPVDLTIKHPIERYIIHPLAGSTATRGFGHDFKPVRGSAVTGSYGSQQPMRFKTVGSFTTEELHKPIYIQGLNLTNTTDNTTKRPLHGINLVRDVAPHGPTSVSSNKPSLLLSELIINVPPFPPSASNSPFVPYDYDSPAPSPTTEPELNSGTSGEHVEFENYKDYDESNEDERNESNDNKNNNEENYSSPEETSDYQSEHGYTFTKDEQIEAEIPVWTIHETGTLGDYSGAGYINENDYKENGYTDANSGTQSPNKAEDYDGEYEGEAGEEEDYETEYEDGSDSSDPETESSKKKITFANTQKDREESSNKSDHVEFKQIPQSSVPTTQWKRSRYHNDQKGKVDGDTAIKATKSDHGELKQIPQSSVSTPQWKRSRYHNSQKDKVDGVTAIPSHQLLDSSSSKTHTSNDDKVQTERRRRKQNRTVQSRKQSKQLNIKNKEENPDSRKQSEKDVKKENDDDKSLHKTLERILDGRDSITRDEDIANGKEPKTYSNYWTLEYSFPHE